MVAWRSELCTKRSLVWAPRLARRRVGKVNAMTLPSSPMLRVLEQSPQLGCFIVTAPGWVQSTELILLYISKDVSSLIFSVCPESATRSPPAWMQLYYLPRKLIVPGFGIRPVWVWSTKQQTATVPEGRSVLLAYPILQCNVEQIIMHAHVQELIFGQTYLSDFVRVAISQTFRVFPLNFCTYGIRLVTMKVTFK